MNDERVSDNLVVASAPRAIVRKVAMLEDCEVSCRSTCAATILRLAAFCGACGNIRRVGLEYLQQLPAATSPRMITSEPATATETFHVAREV